MPLTQDPSTALDDPTQQLRKRVAAQISGVTDDPTASTQPSGAAPSTTPAPFTTQQPSGSTAPAVPSPTISTQPVGTPQPLVPASFVARTSQQVRPPATTPDPNAPPPDPNAPAPDSTSIGAKGARGSTPASTTNDGGAAFLAKPGIANGGGWGGGWDQSWASPLAHALQAEIANGLSGQAAIDAIKRDYPSVADQTDQIEYYSANGQYGLPGNLYVAPNAQNNGALDLIQRPPGDGAGNTAGNVPTTGLTSDFENQVRELLMARMAADTAPVDESDPNIAQPMQAAQDLASRQSQQERTALAEQLYASGDGLNTNAIPMEIQQSAEKNSTALGTLKANLLTTEYAAKRADLQNAQQEALASGDSESARQIQAAIADLDAELTREGLGVNMSEFGQNQNDQAVIEALKTALGG